MRNKVAMPPSDKVLFVCTRITGLGTDRVVRPFARNGLCPASPATDLWGATVEG